MFAERHFFSGHSEVAWYLLVKRYFQDIARAMPIRGDRNQPMTVNVQELKRISFDLISWWDER